MKISIIGTGYVGLVTGTCLAENGNDVICMDINPGKIKMLTAGIIPIHEPGLEELIKRNVAYKRLAFTTDMEQAVKRSNIIFIAVGTPPGENGAADLNYVLKAAEEIGTYMNGYKVIVNKSTVPVGTGDKVKAVVAGKTNISSMWFQSGVSKKAQLLKIPKPDRIVIGAENPRAIKVMRELYASLIRKGDRILVMDIKSAEMTKYASNAMLATKISFINEMANVCASLGADIDSVRRGMGYDKRIGFDFLPESAMEVPASQGVKALVQTAKDQGMDTKCSRPLKRSTNGKGSLSGMIISHFMQNKLNGNYGNGKELAGKTIAVWGLSFKPRTDVMRQAPSIVIINSLLRAGAVVKAHDPVAMDEARKIFKNKIMFTTDGYEALRGADGLAVVTEWSEFRSPDFRNMKNLMKGPIIFDGRNLYRKGDLEKMGFVYYGIGRK
jgi:UDPglucose 6-dehydrogenase